MMELQAIPGIFLRVLGALVVLPIGQNLSNLGKTFIISLGLSFFFLPHVKAGSVPALDALLVEFLIGVIIGIPAALTVEAVRSLGELFDSQRGVSFASFYDPTMNQSSSIAAQLGGNFCLIVLLGGGILENILIGLKSSLELFPVYSAGTVPLSAGAANMIYYISFICGGMFKSFLICALIFLTVDLCSVFLSKVLSQAGLNQEVFLAKTICGFVLILCLLKLNIGPSLLSLAAPNLSLLGHLP